MHPLDVAVNEAERRAADGDWEGSTGRTFIGLYALCHRLTYDVEPVELRDKAYLNRAAAFILRCLHEHFGDDASELVEFTKWVWQREKRLMNWALRKEVQRSPVSVYGAYGGKLITEYRVELSRGRRRRGTG